MVKTLFVKWVLGHCRHTCKGCAFNKCSCGFKLLKEEISSYTFAELINTYKRGKHYGS